MSKKKRWIPGIVGFCLILGTTGCAGLADTGNTYALDQRIETFASSGSGRTADGFAAPLRLRKMYLEKRLSCVEMRLQELQSGAY